MLATFVLLLHAPHTVFSSRKDTFLLQLLHFLSLLLNQFHVVAAFIFFPDDGGGGGGLVAFGGGVMAPASPMNIKAAAAEMGGAIVVGLTITVRVRLLISLQYVCSLAATTPSSK